MWIQKGLISLEGIDQTGKTEITQAVVDALARAGYNATPVSDPPELPPWERMKEEYFERENDVSDVAEAWMFLAARLDMVQREVIPALAESAFVVAARYVDSWIAYQGPRLAARFGSLDGSIAYLTQVQRSLSKVHLLPFPGRTWLIRDRPERALARKTGERSKWERPETQHRVAEVYDRLASLEPRRFTIVDAQGISLDAVRGRIVAEAVGYCRGVARNI